METSSGFRTYSYLSEDEGEIFVFLVKNNLVIAKEVLWGVEELPTDALEIIRDFLKNQDVLGERGDSPKEPREEDDNGGFFGF